MIKIEQLSNGRWQVVEYTSNGFLVLFESSSESSAKYVASKQ